MPIPDEDIAEVTDQYNLLMEMGRSMNPDISEFILHTATIDWLNRQFNPDYETDILNAEMNNL
jgi:hypothetical protein